jgi:hypothetical protein
MKPPKLTIKMHSLINRKIPRLSGSKAHERPTSAEPRAALPKNGLRKQSKLTIKMQLPINRKSPKC